MAYLFTYSRLMDPALMMEQCSPDARPMGAARLKGFRLRYSSYDRADGTGQPNVTESAHEEVWGVLYEVPEENLSAFDRCINGLLGGGKHSNHFRRFIARADLRISLDPVKFRFYNSCQVYSRGHCQEMHLERKNPSMELREELLRLSAKWNLPRAYVRKYIQEMNDAY